MSVQSVPGTCISNAVICSKLVILTQQAPQITTCFYANALVIYLISKIIVANSGIMIIYKSYNAEISVSNNDHEILSRKYKRSNK